MTDGFSSGPCNATKESVADRRCDELHCRSLGCTVKPGCYVLDQEVPVLNGRLLTVVFFLLFSAGPWSLRAQSVASDDRAMFAAGMENPAFASAWRDYEAGRYQESCDAFSRLFRNDPSNPQINLAYALAAKRAGKYSHSALALERVLATEPDHLRARLELADAFFLMQQYDLAREQFGYVLDEQPPEGVRENIQHYLRAMKEDEEAWRWTVRLDVGAFHDDNVNVGPADALIGIEPIRSGGLWIDTLAVAPESRPQEAWGLYGALNAAAEVELGRKGFWKGYGWLGAYQSVLDGHNEYEMGYYNAAVGLKHAGPRHAVHWPLRLEYVMRGHEALARICGMSPSLTWAFKARMHWITLGTVEYRDYVHDSDYTGTMGALGETVRWYWGDDRNSVGIGVRAIREDAREDMYANWGVEGNLSADYRVMPRATLYGTFQCRAAKFDERPPLAAEDREDTQLIASCGLHCRLTERWGADISYRFTRNNSNFDLYTYDRSVFTVSTSCAF